MRLICYTLVFLIGLLSMSAQEYHGAALYNAFGAVKSIGTDTKNPFSYEKRMNFMQNGQVDIIDMMYDNQGYPIGFGGTVLGKTNDLSITWGDGGAVLDISADLGFLMGKKFKAKYTYATGERFPTTLTITTQPGNEKDLRKTNAEMVVCVYSNYNTDSHGNWISRDVTQTYSHKGRYDTTGNSPYGFQEVEVIQYVENRKIEYYE